MGMIATSRGNAVFSSCGTFAYAPALEHIAVWHLRRAQLECLLSEEPRDLSTAQPLVTALLAFGPQRVAAGYSDGRVRIWDVDRRQCTLELHGHRAPVLWLALPPSGDPAFSSLGSPSSSASSHPLHLLSAGQDGQVVLWDVLAESGVCRLRGHTDSVNCAALWLSDASASDSTTLSSSASSSASSSSSFSSSSASSSFSMIEVAHEDEDVDSMQKKKHKKNSKNANEADEEEEDDDDDKHRLVQQQRLDAPAGGLGFTASRDGTARIWQLATQHCSQVIPHQQAVCALALHRQGTRLLTADAAGTLRQWCILAGEEARAAAQASGLSGVEVDLGAVYASPMPDGSEVRRTAGGRAVQLCVSAPGVAAGVPDVDVHTQFLALLTSDRLVEVFLLHPPEVAARRRRKRVARARRKRVKARKEQDVHDAGADDAEQPPVPASLGLAATDEISSAMVIRCSHKIRSISFSPDGKKLMVHLSNNRLDIYQFSWQGKSPVAERTLRVTRDGHAHAVRSLSLSSDDALILTACRSSLRFFNATSGRCVHHLSLPQLYPLSSTFVPGDRHVVVGARDGSVGLYSVQSASLHQSLPEAHEGAVWAVVLRPDGRGVFTGGVDGKVRGWNFALRPADEVEGLVSGELPPLEDDDDDDDDDEDDDEDDDDEDKAESSSEEETDDAPMAAAPGSRRNSSKQSASKQHNSGSTSASAAPVLCLEEGDELELGDEVLALAVGGESKVKSTENKAREYLAVSLLDATIRVYHLDTLRFYLKLYGHSLPVLAMAISDDGLLLASGGADKQVKLWGLDFGDCHRSLRARGDAITCMRFVPGTHYLWSGGKDGALHMWDADTFEEVQRLAAHHSELWCMALSAGGGTMVTGGADCSVRVWKRTQEQLFLEEQRELELDRQWERTLEEQQQRAQDDTEGIAVGADNGDGDGDGEQGGITAATRVSLQTIKAGERLLEALQTAHPLHLELLRREAEARRARASHSRAVQAPIRKKARRDRDDEQQKDGGQEAAEGQEEPVEVEVPSEFGGKQPHQFVLDILVGIRSAELETALLVLPLAAVLHLLDFLHYWLPRNIQPTLSCRVLFFLVRTFQPQLSSTPSVAPVLMQLRDDARTAIQYQKDLLGVNRAAMSFLQENLFPA